MSNVYDDTARQDGMVVVAVAGSKVYLGDGVEFYTKYDGYRIEAERQYVIAVVRPPAFAARKIHAIKHIREVFQIGVKEAKYFVEAAVRAARRDA